MKLTETAADMQGNIRSLGGDDHFMNRITSIALNRADAERIEVDAR